MGAAASGGKGFKEKAKGQWREAIRCRPLKTAIQPVVMPTPPPLKPLLDDDGD